MEDVKYQMWLKMYKCNWHKTEPVRDTLNGQWINNKLLENKNETIKDLELLLEENNKSNDIMKLKKQSDKYFNVN